jgi:cyclopropane fatty-acyl-phospholipid synthase-like methyltransferase
MACLRLVSTFRAAPGFSSAQEILAGQAAFAAGKRLILERLHQDGVQVHDCGFARIVALGQIEHFGVHLGASVTRAEAALNSGRAGSVYAVPLGVVQGVQTAVS